MIWKTKRKYLLLLIFLLPLILIAGKNTDRTEIDDVMYLAKSPVLLKNMGVADEAVGVMDKGQLQNLTMNYGMISDTRYEDVGNAPTQYFFDFRYPRKNFTGLCDDFSIFFALRQNSKNGNNGNVIDGWTDNDNEDWVAKDGSYGKTHYNPATDPNPHPELKYPPDSPTTPYLAHSDLPSTWPVNSNGEQFWPGYFRRDPKTGEQVEGEFASDRDVYAVFTDGNNQMGNVVGLEVEMMAYCYGRPYADKFQFYEFYIHNKSGQKLDSCYIGYYLDPDCSDYGEEILLLPDPKFDNPQIPDMILQRDIDKATRPNSKGVMESYTFGMAVLETPKNVGVTGFHYYEDAGPTEDNILWPIITNKPADPDVASFADQYFHGADPRFDDVNQIAAGFDAVYIVASGPFSMEPGETVKSTIVVAVGENDKDFIKQVNQADGMFKFSFLGPSAPPAPGLTAISGDGVVTLYWDDRAERTPDAFTGGMDFEGYRIYRSEDNGQTWGKEIIDAKGNLIGYLPLVQFDLENGISGPDSRNPFVDLGDDTGILHVYEDRNVRNGISYSYTIVAYDQGDSIIYSLESARGTSTADRNFVTVIPRPTFSGKIAANVSGLTHSRGIGEGTVNVRIINDEELTADLYEVRFNGTPANTFDIVRQNSGQVLAYNQPMNTQDNAVVDGFMVTVQSTQRIGGVESVTDGLGKDVLGSRKADSSGSWYVETTDRTNADLTSRSHDYEIRFVNQGAIAYSWGTPTNSKATFNTNIEIWDVTPGVNQQICFQIQDVNNNAAFDEGESINIIRIPYANPQIGDALVANYPADFPYRVNVNNSIGDTQKQPPQPGHIVRIFSYRALSSEDKYTLQFNLPDFDADAVDLSEIRVVPNPYMVGAAWEQLQNSHKVRFMFLPPECTIHIYTTNGNLVNSIKHNSSSGDAEFNLVNASNQALAFGMYVYVVTTPQGQKHTGKFAIIR